MDQKKFAMSYSCGKDSTLALHKMIEQNYVPTTLIVIFNKNIEKSFFHGVSPELLKKYQQALNIPVAAIPSDGTDYHIAMETALAEEKKKGAAFACFGDIDIEANRQWAQLRCDNVGLQAVFPLWQRNRADNVRELVGLGYQCLIKAINNKLLPKELLGKILDEEVLKIMEDCGIDVCGENGEYHTLVVDGPVFHEALQYQLGDLMDFGDYSVVDVR